LILYWRIKTY